MSGEGSGWTARRTLKSRQRKDTGMIRWASLTITVHVKTEQWRKGSMHQSTIAGASKLLPSNGRCTGRLRMHGQRHQQSVHQKTPTTHSSSSGAHPSIQCGWNMKCWGINYWLHGTLNDHRRLRWVNWPSCHGPRNLRHFPWAWLVSEI